MRLYFIRHGQPIYDPDCLTPLGHEQAKALSKRLLHMEPEKIYASSSTRAIQTAQPTCDLLGKEPVICDWANEKYAFEDFHAKDKDGADRWILDVPEMIRRFNDPEVVKLGAQWYEHPCFAENDYGRGVRRVDDAVDAFMLEQGLRHDRANRCYHIVGDNPRRIALFAHYGFGMAFLSSLMDIPYNVFLPRFNICLTGMTEILFYHHGDGVMIPQIVRHSDDGHLYREGLSR